MKNRQEESTRIDRFVDENEQSTQTINPQVFKTDVAKARAEIGETINQGNYESLRLLVSVEVPAYVEDIDDAIMTARSLAEKAYDDLANSFGIKRKSVK